MHRTMHSPAQWQIICAATNLVCWHAVVVCRSVHHASTLHHIASHMLVQLSETNS